MSKIKIKNLRNEQPSKPYDFIVDRRSPLGNPYPMKGESDRDRVIEKYYDWFYYAAHPKSYFEEIKKIEKAYKTYGRLRLFCWCHPKRCHATVIKDRIKNGI